MFAQLRSAVLLFLWLTLLTGVAYPLAMTGLAQVVFPHQANGSIVERDGKAIGSVLIGQSFDDAKYFWSRPSATGPVPYTSFNAVTSTGSTGSNLGPTNPAQLDAVRGRVDAIKEANPDQRGPVPIDLVTASGSGLDPDISPAAAEFQVARIAKARGLDAQTVRGLVTDNTKGRTLGILGEPRVNVLKLNLSLDQLKQN